MFERCLYFNTNTLARKLNSLWEEAFAPYSLTPPQAYLLRLVLAEPGLTQQQIAETLRLNKSTVTRFISALENKGLLVRAGDSPDQREKIVNPSKKALGLQSELEAVGDELYASMCNIIGREKLESFVKSTRKINDKL